jgi:hypothetical protein
VVVYGNRDYEDALIELHDISITQGFVPVAAGAFIAEHSYSTTKRPIAHGRPDPDDLDRAQEFGKKVREKLKGLRFLDDIGKIKIPGNIPYIEPKNLHMIKQVRNTLCFKASVGTITC